MKISQKQAALLAREIVNQLKSKKVQKVSDELKTQLENYVKKRNALKAKEIEADRQVREHEKILYSIVGKMNDRIYGSDTLQEILAKVEAKTIPSLQEIEDEIILKSMFASEDDMQKFVDSIVAKHTKKLKSKILSN